MKNLILFLTFLCALTFSFAAPSSAKNEDSASKSKLDWNLDFDKALEKSKKENKPILILFTGSDWCPPCKNLEKTVISSRDFEKFAKTDVILVYCDFPRGKEISEDQKKHNKSLQGRFGVGGFPTVVIYNSKSEKSDKTVGYSGDDAKAYIKDIKSMIKKLEK